MLFYFCIVVHNGVRHILLFDFLWAHLNLLDWFIKSSGPNNMCNAWYLYIYKWKEKDFLLHLSTSSSLGWRGHAQHI